MTNPKFWVELTAGRSDEPVANGEVVDKDDVEAEAACFDDNSNLLCDAVIAHVVCGQELTSVKAQEEHLVSTAAMEAIDYKGDRPDWAQDVPIAGEASSSRATGKRKVTVNKLYNGEQFWHH